MDKSMSRFSSLKERLREIDRRGILGEDEDAIAAYIGGLCEGKNLNELADVLELLSDPQGFFGRSSRQTVTLRVAEAVSDPVGLDAIIEAAQSFRESIGRHRCPMIDNASSISDIIGALSIAFYDSAVFNILKRSVKSKIDKS